MQQNVSILEHKNSNVIEIGSGLAEGRATENPMKNWGIDLYYGAYFNQESKVFYVVFTSFTTPTPVKKYAMVGEIYTAKSTIISELRKVGVVQEHRYDYLVAYIEERLLQQDYIDLGDDSLTTIQGLETSNKALLNYRILVDYVQNNSDVFPDSFKGYTGGIVEGLLIENELLIERQSLEDILGVMRKHEVEDMLRAFKDTGYLISGNRNKLTDRVTVGVNQRKNFYRFKLEAQDALGE